MRLVKPLARIEASERGFKLVPHDGRQVAVLVPPIDGDQASLLALLADGAAWSTSALALALDASQRTVQRALVELEAAATRALDRARACAALAGAAAGRIHDDLVTPRFAAAHVDWLPRRRHRGATRSKTMSTAHRHTPAPARAAEIVREYGPFDGTDRVNGVTHDGERVWAATGAAAGGVRPGERRGRAHAASAPCDAGTAFDGKHLYQIAEARIDKIDPASGDVVASIPAPGNGGDSGLAWAEGSLWVGQYRDRKIHQIDPDTGAILRTIESNRFVTGVTWVDGELWHGTWDGDESDIRRIDPHNGAVLERLRNAARHRRQRPGVRRRGLVLLRRRRRRQGARGAPSEEAGETMNLDDERTSNPGAPT